MLSVILERLEQLQVDIALVDPTNEANASDTVAAIAVAARKLVAELGSNPAHLAGMPGDAMRIAV